MPCFCFLIDFLRNCQSVLKTGEKNNFCLISRDWNIATHKVDVCGFLKTLIEFCYGVIGRREGGGLQVNPSGLLDYYYLCFMINSISP